MKDFDNDISINEVATLLVKLYADYQHYNGEDDDYAKAIAIAIRMLTD